MPLWLKLPVYPLLDEKVDLPPSLVSVVVVVVLSRWICDLPFSPNFLKHGAQMGLSLAYAAHHV